MERTGSNARALIDRVKTATGRSISPTMMSFILRRSRRCSMVNAMALHVVTGVPIETLTAWSKAGSDKPSGKRGKRAA